MRRSKKNFKPIRNRSQALFDIKNPYGAEPKKPDDNAMSNIEVIHAKYPDNFTPDDELLTGKVKIQGS